MPYQVDEDIMKNKGMGNQPFDMHKPPLKNIPHQDYPKMLYLWPKDRKLSPTTRTAIANSPEQERVLLQAGYRTKPHAQEFEVELPDGFEPDVRDTPAQQQPAVPPPAEVPPELAGMSKADLIDHAKEVHGLDLKPIMNKPDIIQAIQDAKSAKLQ